MYQGSGRAMYKNYGSVKDFQRLEDGREKSRFMAIVGFHEDHNLVI